MFDEGQSNNYNRQQLSGPNQEYITRPSLKPRQRKSTWKSSVPSYNVNTYSRTKSKVQTRPSPPQTNVRNITTIVEELEQQDPVVTLDNQSTSLQESNEVPQFVQSYEQYQMERTDPALTTQVIQQQEPVFYDNSLQIPNGNQESITVATTRRKSSWKSYLPKFNFNNKPPKNPSTRTNFNSRRSAQLNVTTPISSSLITTVTEQVAQPVVQLTAPSEVQITTPQPQIINTESVEEAPMTSTSIFESSQQYQQNPTIPITSPVISDQYVSSRTYRDTPSSPIVTTPPKLVSSITHQDRLSSPPRFQGSKIYRDMPSSPIVVTPPKTSATKIYQDRLSSPIVPTPSVSSNILYKTETYRDKLSNPIVPIPPAAVIAFDTTKGYQETVNTSRVPTQSSASNEFVSSKTYQESFTGPAKLSNNRVAQLKLYTSPESSYKMRSGSVGQLSMDDNTTSLIERIRRTIRRAAVDEPSPNYPRDNIYQETSSSNRVTVEQSPPRKKRYTSNNRNYTLINNSNPTESRTAAYHLQYTPLSVRNSWRSPARNPGSSIDRNKGPTFGVPSDPNAGNLLPSSGTSLSLQQERRRKLILLRDKNLQAKQVPRRRKKPQPPEKEKVWMPHSQPVRSYLAQTSTK